MVRRREDLSRAAPGSFRIGVLTRRSIRFSEAIARFLGTGQFLVGQTVLVAVWITINVVAVQLRWRPVPFILLNLAFSTQAAYAAPLILLAQNRQDDRDRAQAGLGREVNARTQADTEYLARELASVRLALADVVTSEDLTRRGGPGRQRARRPARAARPHRAWPHPPLREPTVRAGRMDRCRRPGHRRLRGRPRRPGRSGPCEHDRADHHRRRTGHEDHRPGRPPSRTSAGGPAARPSSAPRWRCPWTTRPPTARRPPSRGRPGAGPPARRAGGAAVRQPRGSGRLGHEPWPAASPPACPTTSVTASTSSGSTWRGWVRRPVPAPTV